MKQIVLVFIMFLLYSCNKNTSINVIEDVDTRVILEYKIKENDKFEVFYKEISQSKNKIKSIKKNVKKSKNFKKIKFIIPGLNPIWRFDFGELENQEIVIKSINFKYKNKVHKVNQDSIVYLFKKSKWVKIMDSNTAYFKPIKVNNRIDPKLIIKDDYLNKIILSLNNKHNNI